MPHGSQRRGSAWACASGRGRSQARRQWARAESWRWSHHAAPVLSPDAHQVPAARLRPVLLPAPRAPSVSGSGPRGWPCSCASHVLLAVRFDFPRGGLLWVASAWREPLQQRPGCRPLSGPPGPSPPCCCPGSLEQSRSSVKTSVSVLDKCISWLRAHMRTVFGTWAQAELALSVHLLHATRAFLLLRRPLLPHARSPRLPRGSPVPAPLLDSPCVFSCFKYRSCV